MNNSFDISAWQQVDIKVSIAKKLCTTGNWLGPNMVSNRKQEWWEFSNDSQNQETAKYYLENHERSGQLVWTLRRNIASNHQWVCKKFRSDITTNLLQAIPRYNRGVNELLRSHQWWNLWSREAG